MAVTNARPMPQLRHTATKAQPARSAYTAAVSSHNKPAGTYNGAATYPVVNGVVTPPKATTPALANAGYGAVDYNGYPQLTTQQAQSYAGNYTGSTINPMGGSGGGSGGGGGGAAPQVRTYTDAQRNAYLAAVNAAINKGTNAALTTLRGVQPYAPQAYTAPYEMGKLGVTPFSSANPDYLARAETIADQAIREGKSANQVARERYYNTYAGLADQTNLCSRMALQANEGARTAALDRIQNVGANTGLGFGGMLANNIYANDWSAQQAANNLMQEYSNQLAGYGRNYQTDVGSTTEADRLLEAGRTAAAQKYLYENILPTEAGIWEGNTTAARGAYDSSLQNLATQQGWHQDEQGNWLTASGQKVDIAQALANVQTGTIQPRSSALDTYYQMLGQYRTP